jgi:large subunit ribosomal protein L4
MVTVSLYNLENKETEKIEVPSTLFGVPWNADLVHQAIAVQMANSRNDVAHVKERGEVRGGGKKPWKQKGTGRARHGSIRSPLWIGGGVTHGPRNEKDYTRKINKKMKIGALCSVLSKKFEDNEVVIVEGFPATDALKTKQFAQSVKALRLPRQTTTFVFADANRALYLPARNMAKVSCLSPKSLNIVDVLKAKKIVIEREALGEIIKHFHIEEK